MKRAAFFALLMLSGCGFRPLYGSLSSQQRQVTAQLQQIYVPVIPGRNGQELRLALQEILGDASTAAPEKYTLRVSASDNFSVVDIHADNTAGRVRVIGSAHWQLLTVSSNPKQLAQGDASLLDGYNATYEQYFASRLNDEAIQARVAKNLAETIRQQIAVWFVAHTQPETLNKRKATQYYDPNAMPTGQGQPTQSAGPDGFPAYATGRTDMNTSDDED